MATMTPWLSQTMWILVLKPPRDRPSAWSGGSCICASFRPPSILWWRAFFFRPGGSSAGSDNGTVDAPQVVVDLALVVQFVEQRRDDAVPGAVLTPAVEPIVVCLPGAVALGKITPRCPGMENPKDAVDDRPVVVERMAQVAVMG